MLEAVAGLADARKLVVYGDNATFRGVFITFDDGRDVMADGLVSNSVEFDRRQLSLGIAIGKSIELFNQIFLSLLTSF